MDVARHLPTVIWPLRRYRDDDHPHIYVKTTSRTHLAVEVFDSAGPGTAMSLTRHEARMLARRLNECLEYTK